MNPSIIGMWVLCGVGLALVLGYLFGGCTRSCLIYLGAGFLLSAVILCSPRSIRWLVELLACAAFIFAVVECVADTKLRLRQQRTELQEREAAYGEYLRTLARNGMREPGQKRGEVSTETQRRRDTEGVAMRRTG